ncbi:MAG: hypothetical protein KF716_01730 [Anaerolineae bacterium]|nr:hypothetical protein [Anaerolineae bacterium]
MSSQLPSKTDIGAYPIASGLSLEWLYNGRVLIFTWTSINRETIDAFAEAYRTLLSTWDASEPFHQLNDLRFEGFNFTPYLRHAVQQVISESLQRGVHGCVANVVQPGLSMRVVQFFLHALSFMPNNKAELFTDYDKAVAWLVSQLEDEPQSQR